MKIVYFAIVMISSIVSSQVNAEIKMGFVNAMKVMDVAPQVERANQHLEQEFAPRQRGLVKIQKEIQGMEDRIAKDGAIMTESESRRLSRELRNKKRELKRQQDEFREDYNIRRSEELNKLQKKIIEVIQSIAQEEAYDVILSDGGVVWASQRIDITNKVLERLKQQAGKR